MKSPSTTSESEMRGRIDALVCGELAEQERRELLAWLEADPSRWRDCALAFLQAQVWEEALGEEAAATVRETGDRRHDTGDREQKQTASRLPRAGAPRWLMPLVTLAASIAAFACGMSWRGGQVAPVQPGSAVVERKEETPVKGQVPQEGGLLMASVPVKGGPLGNVEAVLQFPVFPPEASKRTASSSVPQHVRKEWERRGYELKEERRYLPAKLPDGRQVMVPVNEVKMKFIGRPVS